MWKGIMKEIKEACYRWGGGRLRATSCSLRGEKRGIEMAKDKETDKSLVKCVICSLSM
jgi:hypothetical protein